MRPILAIGALSLAAAFGPPARATTRPLVRTDFSPIDFSTTERDTTRLNYDGTGEQQCTNQISRRFSNHDLHAIDATPARRRGGAPDSLVDSRTGERPQEVSDDLPEDTALRVIGPPFAFALIIIIGSQVVHFK